MTALNTKRSGSLSNLLLALCLCVLALRSTYTESIDITAANPWFNLGSELASLILTFVLLSCVIIWLLAVSVRKSFTFRLTCLEAAAVLFLIAGFIGIAVASNKRDAVNNFVTLAVPIILSIVLVQLLDSDSKIRLVLAVMVGLACTSTYRSAGQFFTDVQAMIDRYQADPESILRPLGLTAGSFEAWLFEHRLYTKGITGFFTTGNSVASFSILAAFAAIALFIEQLRRLIKNKRDWLPSLITAATLIAVLLNFVFVRSKGGTAAFIFALILFAAISCFGPFIARHRKKILLVALLCAVAAIPVVINYGLKHGRLPGGNSMLVRWQYWTGAARMYADHPFTGVGPGNFNSYYPQYKAPGALETVKDPHNFILSILTQYGPLGLVAFLSLLFAPLWSFLKNPDAPDQTRPQAASSSKPAVITLITIALSLLIFRPILIPADMSAELLSTKLAAVYVLYFEPVIVFCIGFILAWFAARNSQLSRFTVCALLCACIGFCLHNLIDFAIFEPGIYTALWMVIASLVALRNLNSAAPSLKIQIRWPAGIILLLLCLTATWSFLQFALVPVASRTANFSQAGKLLNAGRFDSAQTLIKTAGQNDPLSPMPFLVSGRLYLQTLDYYGPRQADILSLAEKSLLTAAARDPADFRPREKLTDVYNLLAEASTGSNKADFLIKAFDQAERTVRLYPVSAKLRIKLAQAAENLAKTDVALANYRKAVQIEDAYRAQFRMMYPDRELFSRLGEQNYELANQKISDLQP